METRETLIARRKMKRTKVRGGLKEKKRRSWVDIGGRLMVQGQIESWGETARLSVPSEEKELATSSEYKQTSSSQSLWSCGCPGQSASFTGFFFLILHKRQNLWSPPEQISRGWFLWVYHIGLSIDHRRRRRRKQHFKGLGESIGLSFFFWNLNKTD